MVDHWRAQFDAEISFANGGGLRAEGFRLDIPGEDIGDEELGALFVRHLGLLLVDRVHIANKTLVREAHKGSRGVDVDGGARTPGRVVELSHVIGDGMVIHPGSPGPERTDHPRREASRPVYGPCTEFHIGRVAMVANTATHVDAPSHHYPDGVDLSGLPIERLVDLEGLVVRLPDRVCAVDRILLAPYDVRGRAVLIHSGWDRHWGTDTYGAGGHPYLSKDGAAWLAAEGAALVGIDSVDIDDTTSGHRPAHSTLLAAGIPVAEHLTGLDALPPHGFRFHAAPPKVAGMGTFPVRAYAIMR